MAMAVMAAMAIFSFSPAFSQSSGGLGALKKSSSQDTSILMRQAFNFGDYDRAIILASQAIVNDTDNAALYTFRCRAHMAKKDYATALRDCDHAIRLDPGAVAAYNNRAYIWIERKQLDRAIADANKAMELAPADRYFALYNRAYALYLKGDMKNALADINAAITKKDSSASLFTLRAKIQLALDMPRQAVEDAQTALRLSPKQPSGHMLLGDALRKMGAHRQAIESYDRALALKPGYPDALAARAESLAAQGEGQPTLPKPKAAEGLSSGVVRESVQVRAPDISVTQDVAEKPSATAVSIATAQKPAAPIKAPDTAVKPPDVAVIGEKAAQPDTRVDEPAAAPGGYQQSEYAATGDQYWPTPPPEPAPRPIKRVAPGAQAMLDDPCGQIDLPEDDDEEAPVPPGGPDFGLLKTSLAQNIGSITKSRWAASVSAGRNAMEKLLGPLPAEQENQFQRSWALMADYPSKKVVAYLDRLNPLLVEFLALTQATESMLAALEMAKYEAQMAAAYENEEGAREAMENIDDIVARLKSLNQQVGAISSAVGALGEPPNPLEDKCRARRRAKKAFDMFKQGGGAWVLVKQRNDIAWRMEDERITKNEMKFGPGAARSFSLVPSQFIGKDWPDAVISWDYSWTPPPRVIADQDTLRLLLYIRDAGVEYGDGRCWSKIYLRSPHHLAEHVVFDGMLRGWKEEYRTGESYQTLVTETMRVGGEHKRLKPQDPKGTQTSWIPQETSQPRPWPKLLKAQPGWTMTLEVVLNSAYLQGKAYYDYKFDPDAQSPSPMADPTKGQKSVAQAPATPTEEERQMASLKEKMDFHKNNIALLEGDLARYRQMMDGAKDEASRMAIQNIITGKMADLQAEHDAITTLATGEFTRTRTAWDEMVWAQMDANSRELAGRIQEANYRRGMLGRLINLLPPIEREDTRLWAQSQLGPGEPDP
ncbi:MAG: tetratricopeptide repeat protein, partial [Nitrospinota bacterium]|nr:tetratricopeptide repeat protein [Nitrospinota bacterium]